MSDAPEPDKPLPNPVGVDFLRCELELGLGFARLCQTEQKLGETVAAQKALALAEEAFASYHHFHAVIKDISAADQADLSRLEEALRTYLGKLEGVKSPPPAL